MIINCMGFLTAPLYLFSEFFESKATEHLIGSGVQKEKILASKEAEAQVNRAKGTAESQRLLRQSLNKELLEKQAIEKWDGKFPTVMSGSGILPFINISPPKN